MQGTASIPAPELEHCCLYWNQIGPYAAKFTAEKRFQRFRILDLALTFDQKVAVR